MAAGNGEEHLRAVGVEPRPGGRLLTVRYCVDWSEQRHHLAGGLGRALLTRLLELDWVRRAPRGRALAVTPAGVAGLQEVLALPPERWRAGEPEAGPAAGAPPVR